MPYKLNQDKKHKFDKARYNVKNWPEYDQALKNHGSLTIWLTDDAITSLWLNIVVYWMLIDIASEKS